MLGVVKKNLDQRAAERSYGLSEEEVDAGAGLVVGEPAQDLEPDQARCGPPWWQANSKEAYNSGLDALARALENWAASRGR